MIRVRLPSMLRGRGSAEIELAGPIGSIADLVSALDRHLPGLAASLDDSLYNFAVNDALVLHGARRHPLRDGDVVEIVPTIAGGSASATSGSARESVPPSPACHCRPRA